MNKPLIAALATATLLAAGAARAGSDVHWSVGVNIPSPREVISHFPLPVLPTVVIRSAPVVQVSAPVVYQRPGVVYRNPVVVSRPVPVVHDRRDWDRDGDGIPNRHDRVDNRWHGQYAYGDRDHDGIPNRYDRHDNRWQGQHPQHPQGDRDHDGIPNHRDPRDNRKNHH